MLPDKNRLRLATDFAQLRKNSQKFVHPLAILICAPNQRSESRFAFPASRKTGNAVRRNRARRLLREAVRLQLPSLTQNIGCDCLLIVRRKTADASFSEVCDAVNTLFIRAGLYGDTSP